MTDFVEIKTKVLGTLCVNLDQVVYVRLHSAGATIYLSDKTSPEMDLAEWTRIKHHFEKQNPCTI